jgi:TonB family protein
MSQNQTGVFFLGSNQKQVQFPVEFKKRFFSRLEPAFAIILLCCGALIFSIIGLLSLKKPSTVVSEKEITRIQERYARLVLNQPKPKVTQRVEKAKTVERKVEEVKQEEKKEEEKVDRQKETYADKQKRRESGSELRKQQREKVAEQIKSVGLFAAITSSGSGSGSMTSVSDLLSSAGAQVEDLGSINISKGAFAAKKSGSAEELKRRESRTTGVEIEKEKIGSAAVSQVAAAASVNITSQAPEVTGESSSHADRSQAAIQRVVKRETQRLKRVYEGWLKRDPALQGRLSIKFVILPSGSVTNVSIVVTTTNNPEFDETIVRYISRWQFPPVEGSSPVEVVYPFVFESQT